MQCFWKQHTFNDYPLKEQEIRASYEDSRKVKAKRKVMGKGSDRHFTSGRFFFYRTAVIFLEDSQVLSTRLSGKERMRVKIG
jgi:hypothetical protein